MTWTKLVNVPIEKHQRKSLPCISSLTGDEGGMWLPDVSFFIAKN